jgi:hypothetical protein
VPNSTSGELNEKQGRHRYDADIPGCHDWRY